ncbi:MAG: hypothetical protein JNM22_05705 [Saprospiraceae bacterium]|nr:hypothetical protein [Saprospiraceae bacterium]
MAARKDSVQISIAFLTDESKAYAKLIEENKKFIADIKTAQKEGKDLSKVIGDMAESGKKIANIPLDKLAPAQLISRAQQLKQVLDLIPQSRPEYQALNAEYKSINDRLATLRATAKGVSDDAGKGGLLQRILGVAGGVALFDVIKNGIRSLLGSISEYFNAADEAAKQDAALKSRIQSTNGAAQRSFEELTAAAEDLAQVTLFDDDQIKRGQELLLTFTNIRSEVFDETLPVLLDLSTTMQQDVSTSAIQVGKALNDPIAGLKSLSRIGVTFSAEQKNTIATLVEMGDVAGAQRVILAELSREFGGSARAAAQAGAGGYQQLVKRFGELKETIGGAFISLLSRLTPIITSVLGQFEKLADAITDVLSIPVSQQLREQQTEFNALIGVLQNTNTREDERKAVIKKLKEEYPGYLKFVGDDAQGQLDLARTLLEGNKLFEQRILLEATAEQSAALTKEKIKLTNELTLALIEQEKVRKSGIGQRSGSIRNEASDLNAASNVAVNADIAVQAIRDRIQVVEKSINSLTDTANATSLREYGKTLNELEASLNKVNAPAQGNNNDGGGGNGGGNSRIEKAKVDADAAVGSLLYLRQKVSELQKQLENAPGQTKVLQPLIDQLKEAEQQLKDLEDKIARLRAGQVDVLPTDAQIFQELGGGLFQEQGLSDEQRLAIVEAGDFKIQEEKLTIDEINAMRQGLSDEDRARREQDAEDAAKRAEQIRDFELQAASDVASAIFGIERANNEQRAAESIAALEADYRRKIAAAEGNNALQQKLQRELEQKKEAIEKEAARKRQGTALKEAVVQGALAFIRALATGGPFAAAGVAIATAAQVAVIASQKFHQGGVAKFGFFGGKPHSQGGTKGFFDDGTAIEVEKDEAFAVVNKRNAPLLRLLSDINSLGGHGVPFYKRGGLKRLETGGLTDINTTPSAAAFSAIAPLQSAAIADQMERAANKMLQAAALIPREVKSRVVYQDIQEAGADLQAAQNDAAV